MAGDQTKSAHKSTGFCSEQSLTVTPGIGANLCLMGGFEYTQSTPLLGTFDWTPISMEFVAPASGSVDIGARIGFWSNAGTGKAWFDDITVTKK